RGECVAAHCIGAEDIRAHVELEHTRNCDHGFRVVAVLEQREFEGGRSVDEEPAGHALLHLGNPVAAAILANEDEAGILDVSAHVTSPDLCLGGRGFPPSSWRTIEAASGSRCDGRHNFPLFTQSVDGSGKRLFVFAITSSDCTRSYGPGDTRAVV